MASTSDRVIELISEQLGVSRDETIPSAHLVNDLGADSLDLTELTFEMEEEFDLDISDEEVEGLVTVGNWIRYIERSTAP